MLRKVLMMATIAACCTAGTEAPAAPGCYLEGECIEGITADECQAQGGHYFLFGCEFLACDLTIFVSVDPLVIEVGVDTCRSRKHHPGGNGRVWWRVGVQTRRQQRRMSSERRLLCAHVARFEKRARTSASDGQCKRAARRVQAARR